MIPLEPRDDKPKISVFARILDDGYAGPHDTIVVWAGPDPDHRANVGQLIARPDEAAEIVRRLMDGG